MGVLPPGHTLTLENPVFVGNGRISAVDIVQLDELGREVFRHTQYFASFPWYPTIGDIYAVIRACNTNGVQFPSEDV
jgi:hypothetical protein